MFVHESNQPTFLAGFHWDLEDDRTSVDFLAISGNGRYDSRHEIHSPRVFDLVICDLKMPRVDGMTFYRAVAAATPALARRVIFVTGDVAGTDAESLKLASDIASAQGDSTRAAFYRQQLGDS